MTRSSRDSKAHLSELVERASQGEDVLITVRGKVRARLTQAGVSVPAADVVAWRKELTRLSRKYRTGSKSTPSEKLLEDLREDRF